MNLTLTTYQQATTTTSFGVEFHIRRRDVYYVLRIFAYQSPTLATSSLSSCEQRAMDHIFITTSS
jgi:hypothetical protein